MTILCVCVSVVSLHYVFYCSLRRWLRCGDEWKGSGGVEKGDVGFGVCVCVCAHVCLKNICIYIQVQYGSVKGTVQHFLVTEMMKIGFIYSLSLLNAAYRQNGKDKNGSTKEPGHDSDFMISVFAF